MNWGLLFAIFLVGVILYFVFPKKKTNSSPKKGKVAVDNSEITVPLIERQKISHDSYNFIFKLPEEDMELGIGVGQCIVVSAKMPTTEHPEGEVISRKYTPTSKVTEKGTFTLLVKIYRKNVHPKFPDGGKMSQYLESLNIGDKIQIMGPKGKLEYRGLGKTSIKGDAGIRIKKFKNIGMIAGGTGIAPMYQLIRAIGDNNEDKTNMSLLFANKTEEDILLKSDLETISKNGRLQLFYTLDNPPEKWNHFAGFITKEMLSKSMPPPADDTLICVCGPPLMNKLVLGLLKEIGHDENHTFKF